MNEDIYISLVIPAYNEAEVIPELIARVHQAMLKTKKAFEVVIIDDGSTDKTPEMLKSAMKDHPWLRVIHLRSNSGQSAAFHAGFQYARGQVIATIDADLQNDPEEIPRLLQLLENEGYDMINGWRKDRHDTGFRKWQSTMANRIRNRLSGETIIDSACSLKVYKRHCVAGLFMFNGAHRFMPTLVKMRGYRVLEVPVKHSARFAGTAKYGFSNRAWRGFVDLMGVRWLKTRFLKYQADELAATPKQ